MLQEFEYTYWKDGDFYLGYLNDHPDYWTQGISREDLLESLEGLSADLSSEDFFKLHLEREQRK